jgi:hypothetical protein
MNLLSLVLYASLAFQVYGISYKIVNVEDVLHTKGVVRVVSQDEEGKSGIVQPSLIDLGPCPLLAIINVLVLRRGVSLPEGRTVSTEQIYELMIIYLRRRELQEANEMKRTKNIYDDDIKNIKSTREDLTRLNLEDLKNFNLDPDMRNAAAFASIDGREVCSFID